MVFGSSIVLRLGLGFGIGNGGFKILDWGLVLGIVTWETEGG